MLQVGFDIGETGDPRVDHYRGKEQDAAHILSSSRSLSEALAMAQNDQRVCEEADKLFRGLRKANRLEAIKAKKGFDIKDFIEHNNGGILYIVGSDSNLATADRQPSSPGRGVRRGNTQLQGNDLRTGGRRGSLRAAASLRRGASVA